MSYKIASDPQKPIIIAEFLEPFNPIEDGNAVANYLNEALAKTDGLVHYVADMGKVKVNFADLVTGMAAAYATPGSPYANPRLKIYSITNDELIKFGTQASAEQDQYGKIDVHLYADQVAALKQIHINMGLER